ncbi:MAG: type II toxin-antitoxin system RelE/ParE family toxin [Erysipelotrichaceae bacterium]|nr:type II toxin-antitoxin system RelE/ParE family toxin [Erysipelotrichaceae bacterium]
MSETYTIKYSTKAINDLRDIYSYIAFNLQAPETAAKMVRRIRNSIKELDFMPERNPILDWEPWNSLNTHKMSVGKYLVFYIVDPLQSSVSIVRIVYGKRDIAKALSE